MAKATSEVTRFVNYMHRRFTAEVGKPYAAAEANGVVVVVARSDSTNAQRLRTLVTQEWFGVVQQPRPRG